MNEFDPMKDGTSSHDGANGADSTKQGGSADSSAGGSSGGTAYSTADRAYTYAGGERRDSRSSREGQGYTTPNGGHGYVYNTYDPSTQGDKSRRYRSAMIAVSAVLVTTLLAACCFFGAWMATKNLTGDRGEKDPAETDARHEASTSDGLYIDDGSNAGGSSTEGTESDGRGQNSPQNPNAGGVNSMNGEVPPIASIVKLPSKRVDLNNDGKADIELDANGNVLTSAGDTVYSTATVVARVADSVVEITTETLVQSGQIGQYVVGGAGSGVIISSEGFIVTNHHVIDGANTITVRLTDGTEYTAVLVGSDEQTDVAVLWIDAGNRELTVATLGSSYDLVVGEDIIAIGNPLGSLGGTVTEGMISATAREISVGGTNMTLLQVSAPINPGNSGGGLFNMAGELVGIVNAKMSSEEIEGLGFAIPVDTAYEIILELIDHGYVRGRPALGFTVVDVTSTRTAMSYFNSFYTGVYVYDEDHDVMQYGDLILAVDGVKITSADGIAAIIAGKSVGDTVEITVYRNREEIAVTVTLVENVPRIAEPAA